MTLKTLVSSTVLTASAFLTTTASAQYGYGGSAVGVNFGGSYSKTTFTGPNGKSASISNTTIGGSIGVNSASGYGYGGGYGYGYGYGCEPCMPVYSPFTRCYGAPYYPEAVVIPYYGGATVVPVYGMCNGQFIVR